MDILEYAIKMEKDGENYYRELAERNKNNEGLRAIMLMLADEEVKHFNVLNKIRLGNAEMVESEILRHTKNVFKKMKERGEVFHATSPTIQCYEKAQELEKKSLDFYVRCADESKDAEHKGIFEWLADEEKRHYFILDNVIEFISRPETWLEDAEWHHMDEY